jgi:hypothetical protein
MEGGIEKVKIVCGMVVGDWRTVNRQPTVNGQSRTLPVSTNTIHESLITNIDDTVSSLKVKNVASGFVFWGFHGFAIYRL